MREFCRILLLKGCSSRLEAAVHLSLGGVGAGKEQPGQAMEREGNARMERTHARQPGRKKRMVTGRLKDE